MFCSKFNPEQKGKRNKNKSKNERKTGNEKKICRRSKESEKIWSKAEREEWRSWAYRIILMSSLMFTWSGTRNLVLSRMGSCFSPLYLSMITCSRNAIRSHHSNDASRFFFFLKLLLPGSSQEPEDDSMLMTINCTFLIKQTIQLGSRRKSKSSLYLLWFYL